MQLSHRVHLEDKQLPNRPEILGWWSEEPSTISLHCVPLTHVSF